MAGTVEMHTPASASCSSACSVSAEVAHACRSPTASATGPRKNARSCVQELAAGRSVSDLQNAYAEQYGAKAIAIPRDKGLDRALWAVPIAAFVAAAGGIAYLGRRWVKRSQASRRPAASALRSHSGEGRDDVLDRELDDELKRFDEK